MHKSKSGVLKWSAVAVISFVVILGAFYVDTHGPEVRNQVSLATSRQPEAFTELYFANPSAVPTAAKPGQTVPVTFVVKNLEHKAITYRYVVSFTDAAGMTELASAEVRLDHNQSQTFIHNVVVPQGEGRGKMGVQLVNKNQLIHYWLERT